MSTPYYTYALLLLLRNYSQSGWPLGGNGRRTQTRIGRRLDADWTQRKTDRGFDRNDQRKDMITTKLRKFLNYIEKLLLHFDTWRKYVYSRGKHLHYNKRFRRDRVNGMNVASVKTASLEPFSSLLPNPPIFSRLAMAFVLQGVVGGEVALRFFFLA